MGLAGCPKARSRRFDEASRESFLGDGRSFRDSLGGARRSRSFWRWELARWVSRNNFPGDGRSFRDSHGKPAPSLARAPLFWRWGLARLPETIFRVTAKASRARFRRFGAGGWPDGLPETSSWTASGRNGCFINQKRTNCQIFKFGLWMADFILSRARSLSVKPSHFYQGLAELQLYQGRPAAVAVLSSLGGARRSRSLP